MCCRYFLEDDPELMPIMEAVNRSPLAENFFPVSPSIPPVMFARRMSCRSSRRTGKVPAPCFPCNGDLRVFRERV